MSKNFKPAYTVDLTNVDTLEDFNLEHIVSKLNASHLTADDLAMLMTTQMKHVITSNDADGVLIYPDGTCDLVRVEEMVEQVNNIVSALAETTVETEKKQPWYKRLWNKLFGKKNK